MMEIFEMLCVRWRDTLKPYRRKHTQRHFQAASNDLVHYYSIDVVVDDERERESYAEIFSLYTQTTDDDDVKSL